MSRVSARRAFGHAPPSAQPRSAAGWRRSIDLRVQDAELIANYRRGELPQTVFDAGSFRVVDTLAGERVASALPSNDFLTHARTGS